ncbi:hypothetical protein U1Q18_017459 [Sarracenia purpurea var. burkii]
MQSSKPGRPDGVPRAKRTCSHDISDRELTSDLQQNPTQAEAGPVLRLLLGLLRRLLQHMRLRLLRRQEKQSERPVIANPSRSSPGSLRQPIGESQSSGGDQTLNPPETTSMSGQLWRQHKLAR